MTNYSDIYDVLTFDNIVDVARARLLSDYHWLGTEGLTPTMVQRMLSTRVIWC